MTASVPGPRNAYCHGDWASRTLFARYGAEPFLIAAKRAPDVAQATTLFRDGLLLARDLNLVNALLLAGTRTV